MSKVCDKNGKAVETKEQNRFARYLPTAAVGTAMMTVATNAHAAGTLDLTALTTELTSVKTAVLGVIAVAVTIGIAIVGWRWAKRALFSVQII